MKIALLVAVGALLISGAAAFALIAELKKRHPDIYSALGSPTAGELFLFSFGRSFFSPSSVTKFRRFLFHCEFRHLQGSNAQLLGWIAVSGSLLGIAICVLVFIVEQM